MAPRTRDTPDLDPKQSCAASPPLFLRCSFAYVSCAATLQILRPSKASHECDAVPTAMHAQARIGLFRSLALRLSLSLSFSLFRLWSSSLSL